MYLNKKVFLFFKIGSLDIATNENVKLPKAPNTDLRKEEGTVSFNNCPKIQNVFKSHENIHI